MLQTINPVNGTVLKDYEETSAAEAEEILQSAWKAFLAWRSVPFQERAKPLKKAALLLRERARDYAELMAQEMGKPVSQGKAEAEKCAWVCDFYAENGGRFLAPEPVSTEASKSYISFVPLGTLLAVMPWNFPFWQVFRAAAPALTAGNAVILKHASNVTGCAVTIEKIFREAGFPQGLFASVVMGNQRVADMIRHPLVHAVTLTGSVKAGKSVGSAAGEALKKTVLELGGSDAYVILEDADLDKAAQACAYSRMINAGQSCISAKRFIVVEKVKRSFEEKLVQAMRAEKMGDPMDESVTLGPLARHDLRETLHGQVTQSVSKAQKSYSAEKFRKLRGPFIRPRS